MAYSIVYDSGKTEENKKHPVRRACLTAVFVFVFLCLVSAFWPGGMMLMKELIRPVSMESTIQAAEVFAMEMSNGISLSDALKTLADTICQNGYGS